MRASPGVYALLLGSGVSRSAGIPTGWEVVLDLIRRVAAAEGEPLGDDPAAWYAGKYGVQPGYSDLLDRLCRTPIERQQLLKGYFEPTSEERDIQLKLPTPAHHAVAELMEAGLIRVVVTTNFDRLLEQALEQRGIVPTVIGSPDQAKGMIPLTHQKHCIIKVHGDYLDTRILNTMEELETYDPAIASLVDRVFDEFGLIVCGWSATWDTALRASIERSPNRRYSCFWATMGDLSPQARQVVANKHGETIQIQSSDSFFGSILARVRGLEEFDRPHPLSVKAAIGAAKRYVADEAQRVRLHDLFRDALSEAKSIWAGGNLPGAGATPTVESIALRVKFYDASAVTIVALAATIARWSRGEHDSLLIDAIGEIGAQRSFDGYTVWNDLRPYPATLLFYAAGMASLIANRPSLLSQLLQAPTPTINRDDAVAASVLVAPRLGARERYWGLFDGVQRHVPMSDWIHDILRDAFKETVADDGQYSLLFDTFEYYVSIGFVALKNDMHGWAPFGAWTAHRHKNWARIADGLKNGGSRYGGKEFADRCPAFVANGKTIQDNVDFVESFARSLHF